MATSPPPAPPAAPPAASPATAPPRPPSQLLRYTPEGPLGGTFTCTRCGAQAWQPDLLGHAAQCPYQSGEAVPPEPPT